MKHTLNGCFLPIALFFAAFLGLVVTTPASAKEVLIRTKGSDTLARVAAAWARAFQAEMPDVRIEVGGGGSGNGIAALINGHIEIANTSRPLKKREARLIDRRAGIQPVPHVVGLDAVSILVHRNNPLHGISFQQLAEIYGKKGTVDHWTDIGVRVPDCDGQKIIRVSRKNKSGTYTFFQQSIFGKRRHFHPKMETLYASEQVVDRVADEPCAIGYSGMVFVTSWVKTLCLFTNRNAKAACVPPTAAFTLDQTYPMSRPLYMYTLGPPKEMVKSYLDWIMGSKGREILSKTGFVAVP